jgi:hypothetical protein
MASRASEASFATSPGTSTVASLSTRRALTLRSTGRATAFVARASFHSGPAAARCRTPVSFTLGVRTHKLSAGYYLMNKPPIWFTAVAILAAAMEFGRALRSVADLRLSPAEIAALPRQHGSYSSTGPFGQSLPASSP